MDESEFLSLRVGVLLPAAQAAVSGCFWGGCFGGLVGVANHLEFLNISSVAIGVTFGCIAALYSWDKGLNNWRRLIYGEMESISPVSDEPAILEPVRVEILSDYGNRGEFLDLPVEPEQIVALASGIVQGASLTESRWIGRGKPFSRGEFVSLRDELIRRGLARWVSPGTPSRGVQVSSKGFAVMRCFAAMAETSTLELERYR